MKESVFICYYCKKVYAVSDRYNSSSCPKCGNELIDLRMDVEVWQNKTQGKQKRILEKVYSQNKDWRELDKIQPEVKYNNFKQKKDINSKNKEATKSPRILWCVIGISAVIIVLVALYTIKSYNLIGQDSSKKETNSSYKKSSSIYVKPGKTWGDGNSDNKKDYSIEEAVSETKAAEEDVNQNEVLSDVINDEANGDSIEDTILDDFNGDGITDMVAEAVKSVDDGWMQYFIFTDGTNTYKFGEYTNSVFYESKNMLLPVGKEKHLVTSSKWRASALNGEMSHAAIYSIGTDIAIPLFDKEFTGITGVDEDKSLAYVTYHEEATPGEAEQERGILHDIGNKVEQFYTQEGISSEYNSASLKPQSDPQSVWSGKKVQEVIGNYGIHFYVPAEWEIYVEDDDHIDGLDFSAVDGNGHHGWIINTSCYHYEGTSTPFDWAEGQYVYDIGDLGNEHFFICIAAGEEDVEPQYNPEIYFPELEKYREMIGYTAWVE